MKPTPMLMMPGPTPVPQDVLSELALHPVGHRTKGFKAVMTQLQPKLQWLFQTKQPVFTFSASATGAMEASLINTVNAGDEILVVSCGVFSHRWADIANQLGIVVHELAVPMGQANLPEDLKAFLTGPKGSAIKAVCLIHNETSTAVINPLKALCETIKANSDALILVDTVTGLGAAEFKMDDWGIDVAVSGSQKGWMLPPGLSFLSLSQKAIDAHQNVTRPGFYFNFAAHLKALPDQTPYTPAVTLITGCLKALELLEAEGLDAIFRRHDTNRRMTRQAIKALGLDLLVPDDSIASPAATAIVPPASLAPDAIQSFMRDHHSIYLASGQKDLKGKIFRIGHLGAIFPRDILTTISCLEATMAHLSNSDAYYGKGSKAAQAALVSAHALV